MSEPFEDACGLILAAAGSGLRFGSPVPKQFLELDGKPIYLRALEPFLDFVEEAVVVVPVGWKEKIRTQLQSLALGLPIRLSEGGATRQESVENGLRSLTDQIRFVLVHDAARPFVSSALISSVLESTRRLGACVPLVPVRDTVKLVENEVVVKTVDRRGLYFAQTPQGFELALLNRALGLAREAGVQGTDESMLLERMGETVHMVEGEMGNRKLTWREDLQHFSSSIGETGFRT